MLAVVPNGVRTVARALWAAGLLGIVAFVAVVAGLGDPQSGLFQAFYVALYLVPAALCALRAVAVRQERAPWALFSVGMVCWALAYAHHFALLQHLDAPPYPSLSDALWLTYYLCAIAALLLLIRRRLVNVRRNLWIDAGVGGLALAALSAAILIEPILASTGGSLGAVATNLAYPLLDLVIVCLLLGVFALTGWRPGRSWMVLGGAFAVEGVFDTVYLYQTASGTYETGTLLDVVYPIVMLSVALVAWSRPETAQGRELQGWPALAITLTFALLGLFLTTLDHWRPISDVALVLANLTLVAAFARTATAFGDMRGLKQSKELLLRNQSILNSAGEGIYGIDTEGRTTFANAAATELTGYAPEEMLGRKQHALIHHTRADGTPYPLEECPVMAALEDGVSHRAAEDVYWRRDGTSFPVEFTATPIQEEGRVSGAVVVFRDITERREVDRMKQEFTSVVSHELRTPLTSIRGSLGLLAGGAIGEMPPKAKRMLEIAVSNTDRLVRLINDILDIERMESGQVVMDRREIDLAEVLEAAEEVVGPMARDAGVRLTIEPSETMLWADPHRLTQAVTNLVSNAIKFSPPGGLVSVRARPSDEGVLIEVSDQGRGIPPEKLESIFERFQQVDGSDSREKGGTGLGLPIARSIVAQHGGRLWAESRLGEGSRFFLTLPVLAERALGVTENGDGRAVIVCDDDPSVREVVVELVAGRGYRALPAASGAEAIELAISERPAAILLDLLMPAMSGWETATALKARPETRDIPIVVLSVLSLEERASLPASAEGWVEKPIEESSLFEALEGALAAHGELSSVLVVEDDLDLGGVLGEIFGRHGLSVTHARSGREAIRESQRLEPDLLVLDLGLPDGDGFSVVDWLREHERLGAVPIVVYTARDLSEHERARLGADTDVFLKGALSPDQFADRVLDLLDRLSPLPVGA